MSTEVVFYGHLIFALNDDALSKSSESSESDVESEADTTRHSREMSGSAIDRFFKRNDEKMVTLKNGSRFSMEADYSGYRGCEDGTRIGWIHLVHSASRAKDPILCIYESNDNDDHELQTRLCIERADDDIAIDAIRAFQALVPCSFKNSKIEFLVDNWTVGGVRMLDGQLMRAVTTYEPVFDPDQLFANDSGLRTRESVVFSSTRDLPKIPNTRPRQIGVSGNITIDMCVSENKRIRMAFDDPRTTCAWNLCSSTCGTFFVDDVARGRICRDAYQGPGPTVSTLKVYVDNCANLTAICDVVGEHLVPTVPADFDQSRFDVPDLVDQDATVLGWLSFQFAFPDSMYIIDAKRRLVEIVLDPFTGTVCSIQYLTRRWA